MSHLNLPKLFFLAVFLIGGPIISSNVSAGPNKEGIKYIFHDGKLRNFMYSYPREASGPTPLLVDLHGLGNNGLLGKYVYNFFFARGFNQEAKDRGFAAIWPSGTFFSWNATDCCPPSQYLHANDEGFLLAAVKKMKSMTQIDETRVYLHGFSNGGAMAHDMAVLHSDVFAAIAAESFPIYAVPKDRYPERAVSQLAVHAKGDFVVKYRGGFLASLKIPFTDIPIVGVTQSAPEGLDTWADINACQGESERDYITERISVDRYSNCAQNTSVELKSIEGGFHLSPGFIPNAVENIWSFLSQYTKPGHTNTHMYSGQTLKPGQWLQSADGRFRFLFAEDGDLSLRFSEEDAALWQALSQQDKQADRLIFQSDGNLELWRDGVQVRVKKTERLFWFFTRAYWVLETVEPPQLIWQSNTKTEPSRNHRLEISDSGSISIIQNGVEVWRRG